VVLDNNLAGATRPRSITGLIALVPVVSAQGHRLCQNDFLIHQYSQLRLIDPDVHSRSRNALVYRPPL
jgi:hypothetical protein